MPPQDVCERYPRAAKVCAALVGLDPRPELEEVLAADPMALWEFYYAFDNDGSGEGAQAWWSAAVEVMPWGLVFDHEYLAGHSFGLGPPARTTVAPPPPWRSLGWIIQQLPIHARLQVEALVASPVGEDQENAIALCLPSTAPYSIERVVRNRWRPETFVRLPATREIRELWQAACATPERRADHGITDKPFPWAPTWSWRQILGSLVVPAGGERLAWLGSEGVLKALREGRAHWGREPLRKEGRVLLHLAGWALEWYSTLAWETAPAVVRELLLHPDAAVRLTAVRSIGEARARGG